MMRVIMFPAVGVQNENRYIDILVGSLRDLGVGVEGWRKHLSFQNGDVFHVHWPEIVSEIHERKNNRLRGAWIAFQFFQTIRRIKKNGGRVVWTVHDLYPHVAALRNSTYHVRFMKKFISVVDVAVVLTAAGVEQIKQAIPDLVQKPSRVAHHAHYRSILGNGAYSLEKRRALGIRDNQCVFSFIGSLRANKRPDLVVSAFKHMVPDSNFLIVAGGGAPEILAGINTAAAGAANVYIDLKRISEDEVIQLYTATDILVFPGTDYFNSGTLYTSLSLNVPVLAAWTPTNSEIQQMVGSQWLHLYKGDFTQQAMEEAKQALIKRTDGAVCDLSLFEPKHCAEQLLAAYAGPLSMKGAS